MKEFLAQYDEEIAEGIKWILICIVASLVVLAASYRLNAEKQAVVEVNK